MAAFVWTLSLVCLASGVGLAADPPPDWLITNITTAVGNWIHVHIAVAVSAGLSSFLFGVRDTIYRTVCKP